MELIADIRTRAGYTDTDTDTKNSEYLPISIRYSTVVVFLCRVAIYQCVLTCSSLFCVLSTIYNLLNIDNFTVKKNNKWMNI